MKISIKRYIYTLIYNISSSVGLDVEPRYIERQIYNNTIELLSIFIYLLFINQQINIITLSR